MFRLVVFLVFSITFFKAQQIESLKILKTKHDSITSVLKEKYKQEIIGKSDKEITDIYFKYIVDSRKNDHVRYNEYHLAVKDFFNTQKFAEFSEIINNNDVEKMANYSLGFQTLYKEVQDFIRNKHQNEFDSYSCSAKIHFIVQQNNSLYIEKVEGTDSAFNDLALLAFLMTKGKWESATQKGRLVKSKFVLPIKLVTEE